MNELLGVHVCLDQAQVKVRPRIDNRSMEDRLRLGLEGVGFHFAAEGGSETWVGAEVPVSTRTVCR